MRLRGIPNEEGLPRSEPGDTRGWALRSGARRNYELAPDVLAPAPDAAPKPAPAPKPPAGATPFAVAATDDAVIEPFAGVVPWTVTVSPGFSPLM